jgi:hypothetical protein
VKAFFPPCSVTCAGRMAQQASAPHDARISGRDSVLRRQFPKKPDETQCDTATALRSERGEDRSRARQKE